MLKQFDPSRVPPAVITLTINNSKPVELNAFVRAFTSIAKEYQDAVDASDDFQGEAEIFVKEVRSGSIVADLLPVVASTLPIIASSAEQIWLAVEFVEKWKDRITKLASGIVPEAFSRSDLKTFAGAVEAIARDPEASSTLEVATFEDGKRQVKAAFKFHSSDARQVEKTIEGEYRRLESERDDTHYRVLMVFTRSDVGDAPKDKRSGERVIIQQISDRDLPIMYASDLAEQRVKHEIREADDNIFKKGFSVDVSVLYRNSRPMVYRILNVHEVLDLPDE
ncbi:MAG TPA: hypothetical protein PLI43_09655 [Albidovulum sp.]|uniref:hypothetical protein n=1 Tax=Albidovulum sp. TaxID=1872424 RepID=UPI002D0123AA|nr:hypothetical protein [Albidovulum sp.]